MAHIIGTLYILFGTLLFSFNYFESFYSNGLTTTVNIAVYIIGIFYLIRSAIKNVR